ncbi:hypothetical protein KK595_000938 [Salmonella enterica subsp. enterica serovar Typhimurium]|uniref:hypothetical protein n=1 Tax=Salmonella enterica TaxID=28901 RepID=UPI001891C29A|nr:hypothetical protein [Salmonella enterica]EHO4389600.1 hypothetical protein [Salmonella enterica subsp. enterica serovar Typhimurium]EFV0380019.1 hypothetical protein [Salmonella enterica]EHS2172833.1 hypothetical protein [Salmonella enterica subsp. enterica serovar Typhimurium]EIK4244533.1 hypothetical protein [Salmonella enterica subsp. enterica serovar Typhimurium]EIW2888534.1 hypothetical protein [Salmonella enterica subsp. enterica serovar Typhimurium]
MIKRFWTQLDPNKKRWVSIAGGVFVLFAVVTMFSGEPKKEGKRKPTAVCSH